jgi:sugar lactone lactonase YvrE
LALLPRSVRALQYPTGNIVREWALPKPTTGRATPYQALTTTSNGELLVTDLNQNQVRRFAVDGKELQPLGRSGDWPGQFLGAGGLPGDLAEPSALAEDRQHRIYVSDSAYRVVQRFRPDGRVDAVIAVPEDEATEMRRTNCPNVLC